MKTIIKLFLLIVILHIFFAGCSDTSEDELDTAIATAPIIAEVTPVTALTNDTTPDYTFSSTEAGTITYGGSCTSSTTSASSGNNTITFSTLSNGTYDNCTVMVTDYASNSSNNLPVSTFTVDNTTISSSAEDISISSSASDNASVAFGQSYQYQLTTSGTYSGTITYSLSNEPDNMTISSSGLVEWTPTKASQITTHTNITITLKTASGYVLTQTYDLTVTGTCTSGIVLGIWSGDQRTSTDTTKYLGNISAYTDNSTTRKNAFENFNYSPSSADIIFGPTAVEGKGSVFFYHQYDNYTYEKYDNTTHLYFYYFFGVRGSGDQEWNDPDVDIFTSNNTSSDGIIDSDEDDETTRYTSSDQCGQSSTCYKGRYHCKGNTDGAVLGPFTGPDFKIYMILKGSTSTIDGQTLTLDRLESINYFSKDNSTINLDNSTDFTIGYKSSIDCSN